MKVANWVLVGLLIILPVIAGLFGLASSPEDAAASYIGTLLLTGLFVGVAALVVNS